MIFLCFGLVENWKASDIFSTLADKIVKHCVVKKKKSDLFVERVLGIHVWAPGGSRHADIVFPEDEYAVGKQISFFTMPLPIQKKQLIF